MENNAESTALTAAIAELYSDKAKYFITFNEPQCFIGQSYQLGIHVPRT